MVSVIDIVHDGISAVYTYYDPDHHKLSYGIYGILWQIEHAKTLQLPYVYLGYWIKDSHKMNYKSKFHPFETITPQGWLRFE